MSEPKQPSNRRSDTDSAGAGRMRWRDNKIILMVLIAVTIALVLVAIALQVYYSSGAAQLDLSRPEYDTVRSQIVTEKSTAFSATGPMDAAAYDEFDKAYKAQIESLSDLEIYSRASMSDQALGLPAITD